MQIEPNEQPGLDFYQDLHGLESIKQNPDSLAALKGTAQQFEVQFLKEVLHQMRQATDVMAGDDSLVSSDSVRFYQEMSDSQLAMAMASQNKTGLQDKIIEQMSHLLPDASSSTPAAEKLKRSS